MKKVEGIVLQINKKNIIIFTPAGDFIKVLHPGGPVRVGDKIVSSLPSPSWPKVFAAAACLAAATFLIFTLSPIDTPLSDLPEHEEYLPGYLALDINPSLELTFDDKLVVFDCRPLNPEARLLIENWPEGGQLQDVLRWLLKRSVSMGYLDPELDENLVLATLVESEQVKVDPEMLADVIDRQLVLLDVSAYVGVIKSDQQVREHADTAGLSLNRYLLMEAVREQLGKEIPAELPLPEMMDMLEKLPAGAIFRPAGKPAVKIPAPFETDDLPGPPVDPTRPVDPPVDTPGPPEDLPGPPGSAPGLPEDRPGPPADRPGP